MKYMGSKSRHAKYILPIILKNRKSNQCYEPFVGGCNIIDKVDGQRLANDSHYYLIEMWKAVENGWLPPKVFTEKEYKIVKKHMGSFPTYLVGYVGFALSYGGKWFGGWSRDKKGKRNYVMEAYNNMAKQSPKIKGIKFTNKDYKSIDLPDKSIIYCDPPYKDSTKYDNFWFEHDEFWDWCRRKSEDGHKVYVSEYNAPDDFECLWERQISSSLTKNTGSKKGIERLFVYNG